MTINWLDIRFSIKDIYQLDAKHAHRNQKVVILDQEGGLERVKQNAVYIKINLIWTI